MRKRLSLKTFGTMLAAGAALTALTAPPASAANPSRIVGHTYVNDNVAGPNTVAVFDRHADGSLTPTAGSPFAIGGTGLGAGLGSQGAIQATRDGRFLLAADAGSNEISVLRVTGNGTPRAVGQPVPSGGVQPVSIAINRRGLVYVANVGDGGSNYSGFTLTHAGRLLPRPELTVAVPEGSGVGDVLFNRTGNRLVGTRDNTSLIDSFAVARDGVLTPAVGSPFAAQDLGPIGAQFSPARPSRLYVSNAHAGPNLGSVSAFDVTRRGVLAAIGSTPVPDGQTAPCWVEISHDGRYLFAVNTGSANLSSYQIQSDGSLVLLGTTAFTNGLGAVDARLSPDGKTLSVTGGRGLVVSTFSVDGGTVTELPGSPTPLPAGGAPTGIVVL